MQLQRLPSQTYAVMVHKIYVERLKSFLYGLDTTEWNVPTTASRPQGRDVPLCTTLDTPIVRGVSQARRGYVLILVQQIPCDRAFYRLNHLARQNISWIGGITHQCHLQAACTTDTSEFPTEGKSTIGALVYQTSCKQDNMRLRVDCHPRSMTETICCQLQTAASRDGDPPITDPFEGRIAMTMSSSKCTHLLTIVCCPNNPTDDETRPNDVMDSFHDSSGCTYLWGMEKRSDTVVKLGLNHDAKPELSVVTSNVTGIDDNADLSDTVPLSRAYYKLHQVWEDHLQPLNDELKINTIGNALDLGASPGGWTQVLVHSAGFRSVVAVDTAVLADRVSRLPPVIHVQSRMETADLIPHGPYSMLVCDASIIWLDLLEVIVNVTEKCQWTRPAAIVLTFKLPFRTTGSVERHLNRICERMPSFLCELTTSMYGTEADSVTSRYRVLHLMANSDSERTLLCLFE